MKDFGTLAHIRGIIYYRLSPMELKPFAGAIRYGIPNFVPRSLATMYTWLPVFTIGYLTYVLVEDGNRKSKRKNPRDYMFEQAPPFCPPK